ncbi:glycoside hydrolase family 15 protein [Candidatus Saccharibacteria bacterium]|nr:glycoside hydrolase family 15 protein [Candidatus Saccharibacteria bacterium]
MTSNIFSNGEMFVGLDDHAEVVALYFPFVGSEQHTAYPRLNHKIGIWVDDQFSWLDSPDWRFSFSFQPRALVGDIRANCDKLQISLELCDAVASNQNAFVRNIHIVNHSDTERDIRIFFHQAFQISQSSSAETAYYSPEDNAVVHYKGRRVFFVGANSSQRSIFDQYSVGISDDLGHEGTWKDAEDGELTGNSVQMGMVDSTIRVKLKISAMSSARAYYWIAAGKSHGEAKAINDRIRQAGVQSIQLETARWWREWLRPIDHLQNKMSSTYYYALERSMMIIKAHCDRRGAIMASLDVSPLAYTDDAYAYVWGRDAAYSLSPLIRLGYKDEARKYFEFVKRIIHPDGYIGHKHNADGALGPSWHSHVGSDGKVQLPIQTDETASVLYLFAQYMEQFNDWQYLSESYYTLISPMADFLSNYTYDDSLPRPSYDIWEQQYFTSAYTTSVTYAALVAAAKLARQFDRGSDAQRWDDVAVAMAKSAQIFLNHKSGYIHRGFYTASDGLRHIDDTPDISSLYGMVTYGLIDNDEPETKLAQKVMYDLLQNRPESNTYIRFVGDNYRSLNGQSNIWTVPTLWASRLNIELDDAESASRAIDWVLALEPITQLIPEQVDPINHQSTLVSPLVWSHAELINAILDYISLPEPGGS